MRTATKRRGWNAVIAGRKGAKMRSGRDLHDWRPDPLGRERVNICGRCGRVETADLGYPTYVGGVGSGAQWRLSHFAGACVPA